ncbi:MULTISPECIES: hypothetical protein [Citrobacter]|jgi:hypothetical protein|uniref:hypothetical protein n=1 Tax=Citrobacter werkmanii TaxID=67827 RepID=UPI003463ED42|nr:hypothetical protein [Salmonella enterica subsp. enterica serovar Thompson]
MSRKEPNPTPDKVIRPNPPPRVPAMGQTRTNEMEQYPVITDANQSIPGIKLPSIDILNALDYRMGCLKKGIAQVAEKQPEEAEKLQALVSELIEAGQARKAIKRQATYLVTEEAQP